MYENNVIGYCEYCHYEIYENEQFVKNVEEGVVKFCHKECWEILENERVINDEE